MTETLIRSALYLPASNQRAIDKSRTLACDAVILDLEDGVGPQEKDLARLQAVDALKAQGFGHRRIVVRVNGANTPWGAADLVALATRPPHAILVPKVDGAAHLRDYRDALDRLGIDVALWAMIETAWSILQIADIAGAAARTRTECLVAGTNDLAKEMRAHGGVDRRPLAGPLALLVLAARANNLTVLDGVFNELDDDDGFRLQCGQGVEFGFDGKTVIHPRQIDPCNEIFSPSDQAIEWARLVVEVFDRQDNRGSGALRINGQMVERLHLVQARELLKRDAAARLR
jgi:citrate lyase subunit beta/citryl-CoA lyase